MFLELKVGFFVQWIGQLKAQFIGWIPEKFMTIMRKFYINAFKDQLCYVLQNSSYKYTHGCEAGEFFKWKSVTPPQVTSHTTFINRILDLRRCF